MGNWLAVDWRRAPFYSGRPSNVCTKENVDSVQEDMSLKDRRRTIRHVAECLSLSYGTITVRYCKVAHSGCPECWLLKSRISACKLPVVILTCTWQILSSFFVDMWPWMRPVVLYSPFQPRNETTKYAVEAPNLTSSGQVLKDHISHKVTASVFWDREGVVMIDYL